MKSELLILVALFGVTLGVGLEFTHGKLPKVRLPRLFSIDKKKAVWPKKKSFIRMPYPIFRGWLIFNILCQLSSKVTQGAGEGVDSGQKMPTSETCIFELGYAWGSMFISTILCAFLEAP